MNAQVIDQDRPSAQDPQHRLQRHGCRLLRERSGRLRAEAELRRLRQDLAARPALLEAADRELATLTYSISHDLRAPLRAIDGFSQVLLEDYGDRLDAEGRRCLGRVRAGARDLGRLLEDLLKLSRVNRAALDRRPLDLSAMARELVEDLARPGPARAVQVDIAPGLAAQGDPRLMRTALGHLLENAWKYTSLTAHPHIQFDAGLQGGERVFRVRDNGLGFDMAYADKLFGTFQRLHSRPEFEGTGIGLAMVQRILHRHGGRIWAEAEPDRGAAFFFTLP